MVGAGATQVTNTPSGDEVLVVGAECAKQMLVGILTNVATPA
jgi:hypothetical protein